jgi:hypothetical protein
MDVTTPAADAMVNDPNWRVPLLAYLLDKVLPADRTGVPRIARRAKTYVAINGELYTTQPIGGGNADEMHPDPSRQGTPPRDPC